MHNVARSLVTEAEFLSLPESMEKIELIDGEVIVSPSPTFVHQEVSARIFEALRAWARTQPQPITVAHAPLDVRFGPNRILQPDVFVLFDRVPRGQRGPLDKIPALCVEVVSTDRVHDRVTKRFIYAAAGVAEYWVVEAAGLVERWNGPALTRPEEIRDRLTSPLLPGFELDLAALFAIDE